MGTFIRFLGFTGGGTGIFFVAKGVPGSPGRLGGGTLGGAPFLLTIFGGGGGFLTGFFLGMSTEAAGGGAIITFLIRGGLVFLVGGGAEGLMTRGVTARGIPRGEATREIGVLLVFFLTGSTTTDFRTGGGFVAACCGLLGDNLFVVCFGSIFLAVFAACGFALRLPGGGIPWIMGIIPVGFKWDTIPAGDLRAGGGVGLSSGRSFDKSSSICFSAAGSVSSDLLSSIF